MQRKLSAVNQDNFSEERIFCDYGPGSHSVAWKGRQRRTMFLCLYLKPFNLFAFYGMIVAVLDIGVSFSYPKSHVNI